MKHVMTGEMIMHQPATNDGSLRRPPGITILQYSNILTNGREKSERKNVTAPCADNKNSRSRQEDASKSPTTALKDQRALGDRHLFQTAVETPIQNYLKLAISAANRKWHAEDEESVRNSVEHYALDFLRSMSGALCYLTVACQGPMGKPYGQCPHTSSSYVCYLPGMVYVNAHKTHGINFSRAELALAKIPAVRFSL